MSTNYSGNSTATQSPSPAPGVGGIPIEVLPVDGDPLNSASVGQALKVPADWMAWAATYFKGRDNPLYGTGADLDATIAGTVTLVGDKNYNNLTIGTSATLKSRGYIVRVRGTLTFNAGAVGILDNGVNAANGSNVGASFPGARWYSWLGVDGATAPVGAFNGVSPGSTTFYSMGGRGGTGGTSTGAHIGGAGGAAQDFLTGYGLSGNSVTTAIGACLQDGGIDIQGTTGAFRQRIIGGTGGGSGGSDAGGAGTAGGGGGTGGGVCMVFARHIVVIGATTGFQGAGTAYSPICAQGGSGGYNTGSPGGCGGGGGGGSVLVACADWSGVALTSDCVHGGLSGSDLGGPAGAAQGGAGVWALVMVA